MGTFKESYDRFALRCENADDEVLDQWDEAKNGFMEDYVLNDLMCLALKIMVADGEVSERELTLFNECLGFSYTMDELQSVYKSMGDDVNTVPEKNIQEDLMTFEYMDTHLAGAFEQLVLELCETMSNADGILTEEERAIATKLKEIL